MPVSNSRSATPDSPAVRRRPSPAAQPGSLPPRPPVEAVDPVSLSDTDTLDNPSSPEVSSLAVPSRLPPRTPEAASALSDQKFYTASWGSPYDLGAVPAGSHADSSKRRNLNRIPSATSVADDLD